MSSLRSLFGHDRVLLAVVHAENLRQVRRNVALARENEADGVFLISHNLAKIGWEGLSGIFRVVKREEPEFWIGLNFLDLPDPRRALEQAVQLKADGLWVDNAGLVEGSAVQPEPRLVWDLAQACPSRPLYFGGVSFKYQAEVSDDAAMARLAADYMDVVTTSGPATGQASDPKKLEVMKVAIGSTPLGLASGVAALNVADYLPFVSCFLVATGISGDNFYELDGPKVRELARLIHRSEV